MALIQHLEDCPEDSLARETRQLVDLAVLMSKAHNEGITSSDTAGEHDRRPLDEGGAHAWAFIRQARDKVWTKTGLDPQVLSCPSDVRYINFGGDFEESPSTMMEGSDDFEALLDRFDGEWPALDEDLWHFDNMPLNMEF